MSGVLRSTLAAAALAAAMLIAGKAAADEGPFGRRYSLAATAISDELLETIATEDITIRSEAAIASFGQMTLQVNEHFNDYEILEAATLKADGRRLDVPADRILLSNLPNAPQLGIFQADTRVRTIVFPDVAVGDTVHYKTRRTERRRGVSGGFSLMNTFIPSRRFDAVSLTLDAPKSLNIKEAMRGFVRAAEERGERRLITWTLEPLAYQADEPGATAFIDREPYLVFSSYADWLIVGRNFLEAANPMGALTPELTALAEDITKGIVDRREQAAAIFNWTSKNIRYFAVFLGQGGFVPHSAASVLANRYGDCKDHATLMRALLAAKGIEADYVLITTGPVYRDPGVPSPDWFNHLILWLPEFNQYADPTASTSSFGNLPANQADKPVLRAGAKGVVLARTPPLSADSNRLTVTSEITLSPGGTAKGKTKFSASGPLGASLRAMMTQVALKGGDALARELLAAQNWRGTGEIEAKPATDRSEPFEVGTSFDLSNPFFGESNGNPVPIGPRLVGPSWGRFDDVLKKKYTQEFVCQAETYEQIIQLQLPEGQQLKNIPRNTELKAALGTFESRYELKGQTLHIQRRLAIRVPRQTCTVQTARDIAPVIAAASREINWRPQFARRAGN